MFLPSAISPKAIAWSRNRVGAPAAGAPGMGPSRRNAKRAEQRIVKGFCLIEVVGTDHDMRKHFLLSPQGTPNGTSRPQLILWNKPNSAEGDSQLVWPNAALQLPGVAERERTHPPRVLVEYQRPRDRRLGALA